MLSVIGQGKAETFLITSACPCFFAIDSFTCGLQNLDIMHPHHTQVASVYLHCTLSKVPWLHEDVM